ncbi:MAG: class I SAM-dependent methyltransferase, partial [Tannerellaceae bacterium]|nr:class I SAM-dependent methyltransferase [Tannerellaceae bacterium]
SDTLPKVDLIFCKDCLQHLSYKNVQAALDNFKKSGSKYLLVTSYPKTLKNYDIYDGDYHPLNLFRKPFHMTRPLLKIREKSKVPGVEKDKTMYLFPLT